VIKNIRIFLVFIFFSLAFFISCTKINEATELGGDLVPAVDNINTFESFLATQTDVRLAADTGSADFNDDIAIGTFNDPEFGTTTAHGYFSFGRTIYGTYPFIAKKDSVTVDSIVLSMAFVGSFGDTNATQSVRVVEIPQSSNFNDTGFFRYLGPDITVGAQLGTKSFRIVDMKDSVWVRNPSDTIARKTTNNVVRIKLDQTLGERIKNADSAGFANDSAFKQVLKGIGVQATSGNALAYFDINNNINSKLVIYYKARINGKDSASSTEFYHIGIPPISGVLAHNPANYRHGMANIFVTRNPAGGLASNLASSEDQTLYLEAGPGSVAYIKIPELSTFPNKIIHRAELLITRVPVAGDNIFSPPAYLFLDHLRGDTAAYSFHNDILLNNTGQYDVGAFGGKLKPDNTYRFNVTRYVQGVVTRHEPNDTLRLHAPFRTPLRDTLWRRTFNMQILPYVAAGRVAVGGGTHPNPAYRMRLRLIYSNL
jgi:hypothetical protein